MEFRPVRSRRNLDPHIAGLRRFAVVLREAFPHFRRSHTDDRVFGGVVVGAAGEDFDADIALAEAVVSADEGLFHDKAEELLALFAFAEGGAGEQALQSLRDFLALRGRKRIACGMRHLAPVLYRS